MLNLFLAGEWFRCLKLSLWHQVPSIICDGRSRVEVYCAIPTETDGRLLYRKILHEHCLPVELLNDISSLGEKAYLLVTIIACVTWRRKC